MPGKGGGRTAGKAIKPLSPEQAAYIAGIIDGEGYVTVIKVYDHHGTVGVLGYRPYIGVSNTNRDLLLWLQDVTGFGSIKISTRGKHEKNSRTAWKWGIWSLQAKQVLEAALPYLIIKKRQAELVLEFVSKRRRSVGRKGLSDAEREFQVSIYIKLRVLNKRGIR